MTEHIVYRLDGAGADDVAQHLQRCDAQFVPPLSDRVHLGEYAQKIVDHAIRFEAWSDGVLVGLVAAYCNDAVRRIAFITSVSVLKEWVGRGIGERLMRDCVEYAKLNGMRKISLEVAVEQRSAIHLYEKCGFAQGGVRGAFLVMHLALEGGSNDGA